MVYPQNCIIMRYGKLEPSEQNDSKDSKTPCATGLAQAVVADREFIAQISFVI